LLAKQMCSPVRWEKIIKKMAASGITMFIELGPGRTLCNFISKTEPTVKAYPVTEMEKILSEIKR